MKTTPYSILIALLLGIGWAQGQGTLLVMDQFSSTIEVSILGNGTRIQQMAMPFGQSFTPGLSAIDYIRLNLNDAFPGNGLGATIYMTLHSDSMFGPVLGSTTPVFLENGSAAITTFLFPTTIALIPGVPYFFEVLVQSPSDTWNIIIGGYNYPGGSLVFGGVPAVGSGSDLWFQTGIIPEPSSVLLFLMGGGALFYARRKHVARSSG